MKANQNIRSLILRIGTWSALIAISTGLAFAAPVDLTPPKNSMGYADENGYFRMVQRFGDIEFSDGLVIPFRFEFWTGRSASDLQSPYGWHGWRCGPMESRAERYGGDRFLKIDLLCAKTFYLEKVEGSPGQYLSPDKSWIGSVKEETITVSRSDGWKLVFEKGIISELRTDSGLEATWDRDAEGRLLAIREVGKDLSVLEVEWVEEVQEGAPRVKEVKLRDRVVAFDFAYQRPALTRYSMGVDWKTPGGESGNVELVRSGSRMQITEASGLKREFQWNAETQWITSDGVNRYEVNRNDDRVVTVALESATGKVTKRSVENDTVTWESDSGVQWRTRFDIESGPTYRKILGVDREIEGAWQPVMENRYDERGRLTGRTITGDPKKYELYDEGRIEKLYRAFDRLDAQHIAYLIESDSVSRTLEYLYDNQGRHVETKLDGVGTFSRSFDDRGRTKEVRLPNRFARTANFLEDGSYETELAIVGLTERTWPEMLLRDLSLRPELIVVARTDAEGRVVSETRLDGGSLQYEYADAGLRSKTHIAADGKTRVSRITYDRENGSTEVLVTDENFQTGEVAHHILELDDRGRPIESNKVSPFRANQYSTENL